jgi:XTP/dITP diphosphohydrolase
MRRILIATHNVGKLAEFKLLLEPLGYFVTSAGELGLAEPEETGVTFAQNAALKAAVAAGAAGMMALADDSGLCVAALDGGPGSYSSRFAGGDYPGAFEKIIAACAARNEWRARFVCALALAEPGGNVATYIGQADGVIAKSPDGASGFGYDPIFVPAGYKVSYAALAAEEKNRISHRGRALAQVLAVLK